MVKLVIGEKAPEFVTKDQHGNEVKLSDFLGKKLVLYFYPKDGTPGCTIQACNLRDHYPRLQEAGYTILGVSVDSALSHQRFIKKRNLPFPLLIDEDHSMSEKFGVWQKKSLFGKKYWGIQRTTFVIDEQNCIEEIIEKVKVYDHADQLLSLL